jgi:uncharacterized protein
MKILIYLHHPAQFYLFRITIHNLIAKGHELIILATKKDILEKLLENEGLPYLNVLPNGRKDNKVAIAKGLLIQDFRLLKICLKQKPDILIGTSTEICHIGRILGIPNIFVNEDDLGIIPLVGKIAYPFAENILVPNICNTGKWKYKAITYSGYHELAFLHPNHFVPSEKVVTRYFNPHNKYFVIRFAKLTAHHDRGNTGLSDNFAEKIIKMLEPFGEVYITSERELKSKFEKYRLVINPLDIHHVIAFAQIFIGDSQSMAAEAGVLGTPFIRVNNFVGRIGFLADLENTYKLGFGIKPAEEETLFSTIKALLNTPDMKDVWKIRRQKMLEDKIDVASFFTWIIDSYPDSIRILKENPDYSDRFKSTSEK